MKAAPWTGDERLRRAEWPGSRWFATVQLWRPVDPDTLTTADVETAALLLSGTFDLIGGETAWPARGARTSPFAGRPMAVFLPRNTRFRAQNGSGEILLVAARQPAVEEPPAGREGLSHKPLLPLAGSGKAFDPKTGEWLPAEMFPHSPESLPPRRMQRLQIGPVAVDRVLASDYKAATLSLDEAVVPAGATLRLADVPGRPRADELLVFARAPHGATCRVGDTTTAVRDDAVFCLPMPHDDATLCIEAGTGPVYAVLAYGGKH
ncbi:MAG TPA: 5-deoxy-glucuronate isomerase [Planctomycetota bacterium]|nr:5-deoxy-glucuronate isomerase [Planctomycetota bacterium]